MTIRKGEAWGVTGPLPDGGIVARSDADVRVAVEAALRVGATVPPVGLLGVTSAGRWAGEVTRRACARCTPRSSPSTSGTRGFDGRETWFGAHLVARRSWWRGRVLAVVNAQYLGEWDLAPTGHPNDGRLDVVDVSPSMGLRDRWRARKRLPFGTHVPHPDITTRRITSLDDDFDPPLRVWLDGQPEGAVRHLRVECAPDALLVVV